MYLRKGEPKRWTGVYLCEGITDDFNFLCSDYLNFCKGFTTRIYFFWKVEKAKKKSGVRDFPFTMSCYLLKKQMCHFLNIFSYYKSSMHLPKKKKLESTTGKKKRKTHAPPPPPPAEAPNVAPPGLLSHGRPPKVCSRCYSRGPALWPLLEASVWNEASRFLRDLQTALQVDLPRF